MKFKTSVSLMIALVLGLVTAKVGLDMLKKYGTKPGAELRVVMAAHDMEPGSVLQAEDVKLQPFPVASFNEKMLRDPKAVVGRTVLTQIVAGVPLIDAVLAPAGTGAGMQALVPKGFRAVTVEVSESSGVAGLLTPGCHVDVIATLRKGDETVARTVVENVKVQYVQRRNVSRSSNPDFTTAGSASSSTNELGPAKTVTLVVTPKQAAAIELANAEGKPRLVLRGGGDTEVSDDGSISRRELLGLPEEPEKPIEPAAPPPAAAQIAGAPQPTDAFSDAPETKKGRTVEIIRNGSSSTITFDEDNADQQQKQDSNGSGAVPAAGKDGKRVAAGEPAAARRVSGSSPDKAPGMDAGSGNLRKGN